MTRDDLMLDELAPGVWGWRIEIDDSIYIPVIRAADEGDGSVGRYIDNLPKNRRIVFPTVISERLRGMLTRRGFKVECEYSEEMECSVECYVRA